MIYIILTILALLLFAVWFFYPISCEKWRKYQTKTTYKKYPEIRIYNHNADSLTKQINQFVSLIEKNQKEIDGIFLNIRYCGETEKETEQLKKLQEETRSLYAKANTLMDERALLHKERSQFISSHNIRYY